MEIVALLSILIAMAALIVQIIVWRTARTDRILENIHQRLIEIRNTMTGTQPRERP